MNYKHLQVLLNIIQDIEPLATLQKMYLLVKQAIHCTEIAYNGVARGASVAASDFLSWHGGNHNNKRDESEESFDRHIAK